MKTIDTAGTAGTAGTVGITGTVGTAGTAGTVDTAGTAGTSGTGIWCGNMGWRYALVNDLGNAMKLAHPQVMCESSQVSCSTSTSSD